MIKSDILFKLQFSLSKIYAYLMFSLAVTILLYTKDVASAVTTATIGAGLLGFKTYTVNRKEIKDITKQ